MVIPKKKTDGRWVAHTSFAPGTLASTTFSDYIRDEVGPDSFKEWMVEIKKTKKMNVTLEIHYTSNAGPMNFGFFRIPVLIDFKKGIPVRRVWDRLYYETLETNPISPEYLVCLCLCYYTNVMSVSYA